MAEIEQMVDAYGVPCDVHPVRTFRSGWQLGAGYDLRDPATWFVYTRDAGPVANGQWHRHCGPYSTFEQAKDWCLAIRESGRKGLPMSDPAPSTQELETARLVRRVAELINLCDYNGSHFMLRDVKPTLEKVLAVLDTTPPASAGGAQETLRMLVNVWLLIAENDRKMNSIERACIFETCAAQLSAALATPSAPANKKCFDCDQPVDDARYDICSKCDGGKAEAATLRAQVEHLTAKRKSEEPLDNFRRRDSGYREAIADVLALIPHTKTES